jgi:hypothetical protein
LARDAIKVVEAQCRHTRRGAAGGLVLELADGEPIKVPLHKPKILCKKTIRLCGSLKYTSFFCRIDFSVTPGGCPRDRCPPLVNWLPYRY